jgi:thiamine-monophosphate kinase
VDVWLQRHTLHFGAMRDEAAIIELITRRLGARSRMAGRRGESAWLPIGVGDDAAVINLATHQTDTPARSLVLSCDSYLEGVHFLPELQTPETIGYKALARATSDLAAMGAQPRFFLMTLALPPRYAGAWLEKFALGLNRAAREFKMVLIGGDTSAYRNVAIGFTVGGSIRTNHALTRSGARPGDQVFVSGKLGAAQLAFDWLTARPRIPRAAIPKDLLERHLRPRIRIALGQWLSGESPTGPKIATAAVDTSDGLSTDLSHLCDASGVAARIYSSQLPLVRIPTGNCRRRRLPKSDAIELALHGGEDYELLFTVPSAVAKRIPNHFRGAPLTRIGEIVAHPHRGGSSLVQLIDATGRDQPLERSGWDSFQRDH